jgi:hypothetical protein
MRSAAYSQQRQEFASAITAVLDRSRSSRVTQKQLARQIAAVQIGRRRRWPSVDREAAMDQAQGRWQRLLSDWRSGHQIPRSEEELLLAIGVIDPDSSREGWVRLWRVARNGGELEADASTEKDTASASTPAVTNRWRATLDGMPAARVSYLGNIRMDHPGYAKRDVDVQKPGSTIPALIPAVRLGTVVACYELPADIPSTSQLRKSFLDFLDQPTIIGLLADVTSIRSDVRWTPRGNNGRSGLGAVLASPDDDDTAPVAWAKLIMTQPGAIGTMHDPRLAGFVLHIEPRTPEGEIASGLRFSAWPRLMAAGLGVPTALARFLTDGLTLTTYNDPATCAAIWLTDAPSLVDIEEATVLAGETSWPYFTGYAIADPGGQEAETVARQLVQHLADYTLHLDGYEHLLRNQRPGRCRP